MKKKKKWNCREKIDVGQSMGPCRSNNSSLSCFEPKKGTNICSTSLELLKRSVLKWRSVFHSLKCLFRILLWQPCIYLQCLYLNQGTKTFFENKRFWSFFANRPIKFNFQLYTTVENFKSLWTYLTSQEMVLKIHDFYGSVCKKPWESFFFFRKMLWLDNLCPSSAVREVAM